MNEQNNSERRNYQIFGLVILIIGSGLLVLDFWLWSNGAYPYDNPIAGINLLGIVVSALPLGLLVVMGLVLIIIDFLHTQKHAEECSAR